MSFSFLWWSIENAIKVMCECQKFINAPGNPGECTDTDTHTPTPDPWDRLTEPLGFDQTQVGNHW